MTTKRVSVHPSSDVQSTQIGPGTRIWQFVVVLSGARIGADCNICSHCFIENDVVVGDRVTVKSSVQLWDGLRIADDVFIGPNVTFTNDRFPRSKCYPGAFVETLVGRGASIGGGGYYPAGRHHREPGHGRCRGGSDGLRARFCNRCRQSRSGRGLGRGRL